jgi:hypothetical protein
MVKNTFKIVAVVKEENKQLIWDLLQIALKHDDIYFAFEEGNPSEMMHTPDDIERLTEAMKKARKLEKPTLSRKQVSKLTKESMDKLKSEKRVFTGAVFGWDNQKDGTMKPNWKEQETIDMMRYFYHEKKQSFSFIAKWLNANDVKGKRGGKWQGQGVSRVVHNDFHASRNDFKKPKWFLKKTYPEMTWGKNPKIVS